MYKLLLIDDDPNIVNGLEHIIHDYFPDTYSVSSAYDGYQALKLMTDTYFHVIISDIMMPQLDGVQLLELIHSQKLSSIVIMLSGYDDYSYIRSALRLGAFDYLLKPINIQSLIDLLTGIQPGLPESGQLLPANFLTQVAVSDREDPYFDLPPKHGPLLTEEQLKQALETLSILVLNMDSDEVRKKTDDIFYHLSPEIISKSMFKKALSDFLYNLMQRNTGLIKIIAQYKLTDNDLAAQIKNQSHISQLKEKFIQILILYIQNLDELKKKNEVYVVKKAQEYINTHLHEQLLLADIAAQFHLHPNYFSSLFKKQLQITVRDYILQLRIEKAKSMMRDPSLKLLDIALAVGYQDASHFNRAFKNVTDLSPSQYREKLEKN